MREAEPFCNWGEDRPPEKGWVGFFFKKIEDEESDRCNNESVLKFNSFS
jgi:hypothetical protein